MLPPCFHLADRVYPFVRQAAARRMAQAGMTQAQIGERLGVSQAMVSKYLNRAGPSPEEALQWVVDAMAEDLAGREEGATEGPDATVNPWCRTFHDVAAPAGDARHGTLAGVTEVLTRLESRVPEALVPAVNVNVAGALPGAEARDDILAFPGRLALVGGRLRAHGPPEFGASRHLASVLLAARTQDDAVRFVVNLRDAPPVQRAFRAAGEAVVRADPATRDAAGVAPFRLTGTSHEGRPGAWVVRDPGGVGVEPAVYVLDADPARLAERVSRVATRLP